MRRVAGPITGRITWLALIVSLSILGSLAGPSPAWAQDDDTVQPGFSLSSRQIYTSKDSPSIDLDFQGVDHLDFRVYKVQDPRALFAKLKAYAQCLPILDDKNLGSNIVTAVKSGIHVADNTNSTGFVGGVEVMCPAWTKAANWAIFRRAPVGHPRSGNTQPAIAVLLVSTTGWG